MDQARFDRIARALGGSLSRRRGIAAALGMFAGGSAAAAAGADAKSAGSGKDAGKHAGPANRRPQPAGPCGSGSVKENHCAKDSECCTNICKMKNKGKDGSGRCRCQRKNKPCTEDRNCCSAAGQQMTCVKGHCNFSKPPPAPVPTGQACKASKDTCADPYANCTEFQLGTPTGTYCLLPDGEACAAAGDCESDACTAGVCVTSCTVCATGCPYTKITDAIAGVSAGSTIHIAPGAYDTYGKVDDTGPNNLTLRRCGARDEVRWTNTDGSSQYIFRLEDGYTATLENLTFLGIGTSPDYGLLSVEGDSSTPVFSNLTVNNCVFENMFDGDSYSPVFIDSYTNATFTGCTFRNNFGYSDGGAIYCSGGDSPVALRNNLTLVNCTFYQNQNGDTPGNPDSYAGALYVYQTNATITGCTFEGNYGDGGGAITSLSAVTMTVTDTLITGNRSTTDGALQPGGGILLVPTGRDAEGSIDLTLAGTTSIVRNYGSQGSGIAVQAPDPTRFWTVTGAEGRVKNNSGAPDQCAVSTDTGSTWNGVANCAF